MVSIMKRKQEPMNGNGGSNEKLISASEHAAANCNTVADHIEVAGQEAVAIAESLRSECQATAANLREVGELVRTRVAAFYECVKDTHAQLQRARDSFSTNVFASPPVVTKALKAPALDDAVKDLGVVTTALESELAKPE